MKLTKYLPFTFVYIQGLSVFNPIYIIFLIMFSKNILSKIFIPTQLLLFIALMFSQFLAILLNPHSLPVSLFGTVLGLFAFALKAEKVFNFYQSANFTSNATKILIFVLGIYFLDSIQRIPYLELAIIGFSDYEFKEYIKSASFLVDDTNTLALRIILLYYISKSLGLVKKYPNIFKLFFVFLMLTTYSRAGLAMLILILIIELKVIRILIKQYFLKLLMIIFLIVIYYIIEYIELINSFDSSVISKFTLVVASYQFWDSSDILTKLIGSGYYSNVDVGTFVNSNWASGHSIVYYFFVDFGLIGSLLLTILLFRQASSFDSRTLLFIYFLIGLSLFRFDFLFLYITLFFTNNLFIKKPFSKKVE